ncbi:phosphoglycolate phosphatase [Phenylobacterium sp.]|uniref:phosphoglycolate phosphatase n=1 Tax=Phenylobacterium sp. TaxID=1871053 RepID=UPI003562D4CF
MAARTRAARRGAALSDAVVAFDLDGTLVDTAPDLVGTLNVILAEEGLRPLAMAHARDLIGHGARRLLERGFQAAGEPLPAERMPALFDRFIARYLAHIADESRPFPGVVDALEALRADGARLAVCTNKPTGLSNSLLRALDLARLFDAVVGPDAAPAAKPDPRHLEAAIAAAGGTPDRALMVGDAATDAGAARAARVPLILVSFGYTEVPARDLAPDVLIDHFAELPDAVQRLLGACEP